MNKRFIVAAFVLFASLIGPAVSPASADNSAAKANYELAARFTPKKVGKMVFDTSVSPRWLETGDRFWYSYETSLGKKFFIVDPARRTKTPIFDNARMAALLTKITLIPYDAQHLPIKTLKFVKKDTVIQFELEVPKDDQIDTGDQGRQGLGPRQGQDEARRHDRHRQGEGRQEGQGARTQNKDARLRIRPGQGDADSRRGLSGPAEEAQVGFRLAG